MELEKTSQEQTKEELDIRQYLSLLVYRSWLIILVGIVAGAISYLISIRFPPIYESTTSVLVNEAPESKSADYSSVLMSKQLTSTYSQMMVNDLVLKQVASEFGLTNPLDEM